MPISRKRRRPAGPAKPTPYAYAMDRKSAGLYDRLLGNLLRQRELSPNEFVVVNRALWSKRSKGSDRCQVTVKNLCEATSLCRDVVNRAIQRAISLGLLRKIKMRIRRAVGAFSTVRWVNDANVYVFTIPQTETEAELEAEIENVSQSFGQPTPLKAIKSNNQSTKNTPNLSTEETLALLRAKKSPLADVFEGWAHGAGWLPA